MLMLIEVAEDIRGHYGTRLTYECEPYTPGTAVKVVSGALLGMLGTVVGPSEESFPYYEKVERLRDNG